MAHEVTNVGHDRSQLANMAGQAKAAMGAARLEVLVQGRVRESSRWKHGLQGITLRNRRRPGAFFDRLSPSSGTK